MAELSILSKWQPVLIIISAFAGLVLSNIGGFPDIAGGLIEPFLMVLLLVIFLKVDFRDVGRSFGNIRFTATALAINFVWTPAFAALLGLLFFGEIDMRIGLLMLLVTPCTDWFLVFTAMTRGNVALSTAILPLNLVLQLILLPVYLAIYLGSSTSFDFGSMLMSIVVVLIVPLAVAAVIKLLMRNRRDVLSEVLDTHGDNMQLVFLCLAVVAMFAYRGYLITDDPMLIVQMLLPLAVFFAVNLALSQLIGKTMGFPWADRVSLTFTTLARNSPLALAIAVAAFPDRPLISLVLVVGPLIELPVLSAVSALLNRAGKDQ